MKPRITAIMPTYNRSTFIIDAIESIRNQTMKDWELIVVDDGSTDSTPDLMEFYTNEDPRIKYIRRKVNKGIAISRNEAIEAATSDKIIITDSDDIQEDSRFKKVLKYWSTHKDVDIVYHRMFICTEDLQIVGQIGDANFTIEDMFKEQAIPHPVVAFKKSVWKLNPYNPKAKYGEDWEFLLKCCLEGFIFGHFRAVLVQYREHREAARLEKAEFVKKYDIAMVKRLKKEYNYEEK